MNQPQKPTPEPLPLALDTEEQFSNLTEDELIEMAVKVVEKWGDPAGRLVSIILALKARRQESAQARASIAEYLRQLDFQEERFGGADDLLATVHSDPYQDEASLRLSDLRTVIPPSGRDTEAEFFAEQERRLHVLMQHEGAKLPEAQRVLLECVSKSHIRSSRYDPRYKGEIGCICDRATPESIDALIRRPFMDFLVTPGHPRTIFLMLKKPE